jgi:hypothetical protein
VTILGKIVVPPEDAVRTRASAIGKYVSLASSSWYTSGTLLTAAVAVAGLLVLIVVVAAGPTRGKGAADSPVVNPLLQAWADVVDVSAVNDQVAADIDDFLRSYSRMLWFARRELGFRLVSVVSSQVTPPPSEFIAPIDVLATVRAKRELLRGAARPDSS